VSVVVSTLASSMLFSPLTPLSSSSSILGPIVISELSLLSSLSGVMTESACSGLELDAVEDH
jgi:hypothetical protein